MPVLFRVVSVVGYTEVIQKRRSGKCRPVDSGRRVGHPQIEPTLCEA